MASDSNVIAREPCPKCGSRDNLARYDDGHAYCFSVGCNHYEPGEGQSHSQPRRTVSKDLLPLGEVREIKSRGLTEKTCQRWRYTIGHLSKGAAVQLATYFSDDGQPIAQKARTKNKDFLCFGDMSSAPLYGKHLCRSGGRRIIICEGEIDAMTVDQVLNYKWQVVSPPNGVGSLKKCVAENLEWLNTFEQIVLCMDMDEPGRKAVESVTSMFPPGKLAVVSLPLKDPNEMLLAGRVEELVNALWGAKEHRPDGLKTVAEIRERIFENISTDLTWFDPRLNKVTFGRRYGECVGFGAGTGVGKTTYIMQQLAHDILGGHSVGVFAFEQDVGETVRLVAGQMVGKTFHTPDGSWTDEELSAAVDVLQEANRLHLYDHFGACEWDVVKERIRYLTHAHGVRVYLVDHLTALAAAEDNERIGLERILAEISSLAQELSIWIGFVSHLATPEGKPHEEGGRVMIRHFKGSRAIGFWAHEIYGLERNQQADDEGEKRQTIIRILKHRKVGRCVGTTFPIRYEDSSGRLLPVDDDEETDDIMKSDESADAF